MSMIPDLAPVKNFHEADELEYQLKAMTLDILRDYIRSDERDLNVYGAPHLGSFDLIERWVKADGLAMNRSSSQESMRFLFNAWRSRNPKRGLHFLRTYCQLLWPSGWDVNQMWQPVGAQYPLGLLTKAEVDGTGQPAENFVRTSRVTVDVSTSSDIGAELNSVESSIRSACGAKYVVKLRTLRRSYYSNFVASTGTPMQVMSSSGALLPFVA